MNPSPAPPLASLAPLLAEEPALRAVIARQPTVAVPDAARAAFVASLVGHSLSRNAFVGAIIAVIIFVAVYVFWDFYPHGLVQGVRFPTRI